MRIGLGARNIGSGLRFQAQSSPAPTVVQTGAAFRWASGVSLALAGDFLVPERKVRVGTGIEYALPLPGGGRFSLRSGLSGTGIQGNLFPFRGGLGVSAGAMSLDYAFMPTADLGAIHRFTLGIRMGQKPTRSLGRKPAKTSPARFSRNP